MYKALRVLYKDQAIYHLFVPQKGAHNYEKNNKKKGKNYCIYSIFRK